MRFELSVALKYLIPRWKQLSVAIISLVSTLVVAMVVWLVLVFLSVTDGLEKKWIEELVSINAPVRMAPTDRYYDSYYYQIDSLASDSNYRSKSIGEKLASHAVDPYDPTFDSELPSHFPLPDKNEKEELKDLVKEAEETILSLQGTYPGMRFKEYEVSFGTLQLKLHRDLAASDHSYLSQISYIATHSLEESKLSQMIVPPTPEDYQHFLTTTYRNEEVRPTLFTTFFSHAQVESLHPAASGYRLPKELYPSSGHAEALVLYRAGLIEKVLLPADKEDLQNLKAELAKEGRTYTMATIDFGQKTLSTLEELQDFSDIPLIVTPNLQFKSRLLPESISLAERPSDLQFAVTATLQSLPLEGTIYLDNLRFSQVREQDNPKRAPWLCPKGRCGIPSSGLEQGVIISKQFRKNGVMLGDRGAILYSSPSLNAIQEQQLPIFVAGFYDPGLFPMGSKLIFVEPAVTEQLRSNVAVSDTMLGNGFNIWIDQNDKANHLKEELEQALQARGLAPYWKVESFTDYEFAKPILTQLKSDKNLFTLIALIILLVACSNIISMLILLVNDKKREIAIIQAMGASSMRVGLIFGFCGFVIGLFASILGVILSLFTLKHLQSLVDFLSFIQGHDAFQAAFYGSQLPNQLSLPALFFVLIATTLISLIAALVPAIKAAKIRPSQTLRSEG